MTTLISGGSLIQSSFGAAGAHNLEAVITRPLDPNNPPDSAFFLLQHYRHVPDGWQLGATITNNAIGPGALCQRRDRRQVRGNFEVVVPEVVVLEVVMLGGRGVERGLVHYSLDNSRTDGPGWNRHAGFAAPGATGAGAILENRDSGNLEMVAVHRSDLVHHRFDGLSWSRIATISRRVTGPPTLMQSDYGDNLEVLVAEHGNLVLYWYDGTHWNSGGIVTGAGKGPCGFAQGRYGADPHRNFEVVVPRGDTLAHYWRDNSREELPWRSGGRATWGAGQVAAAALCSSDLGSVLHAENRTVPTKGWLQALTQEGTSIYHLYQFGLGDGVRWMRSACIRLDDTESCDVDEKHARSHKIAQITGEIDIAGEGIGVNRGGWTLSRSHSAGIHGADLGVSVTHAGRRFLLFGDTSWDDKERNEDARDSIAKVTQGPDGTLTQVTFHGSPLTIEGGEVTQKQFDVPLDAFSADDDDMFVFFSSDHSRDGKVMGRSVLTRALDPAAPIDPRARASDLRYLFLTTFSDYRFINVSVQLRPASAVPGFRGDDYLLLVWGSGAYRADDLRLAVIDLRDPATWSYLRDMRSFPVGVLPVSYFAGLSGDTPLWSLHEEDARPLLWPGALGEISVRWVPQLRRYVLMAMAGPEDPIGKAVWMRVARNPWGPWSRRRQVLDWILDGMGRRCNGVNHFIHDPDFNDGVGDCLFTQQCQSGGDAYAPYLYDAKVVGDLAILRYTLSTWNPYQVMLMQHKVRLAELQSLELHLGSAIFSDKPARTLVA